MKIFKVMIKAEVKTFQLGLLTIIQESINHK